MNSLLGLLCFLFVSNIQSAVPPLTTNAVPPPATTFSAAMPTTPRACYFEAYNTSSINDTYLETDRKIYEAVHMIGDAEFCKGVCTSSVVNHVLECWAFTFHKVDRCYLYYYSRPLSVVRAPKSNQTETTLYLKRCSDDRPDTSAQNHSGIIAVNTYSYKITGTSSPVRDTCFFLNQTFVKGDHWKDTCRFDCECINANLNQALCTDICTHFNGVPPSCVVKTLPGQCCPSLHCGATDNCTNVLKNCDYYPDSNCKGIYSPWAHRYCALRCGYCPGKAPPCVDKLSYCHLYDLSDVCGTYQGWARHNCRASCKLC